MTKSPANFRCAERATHSLRSSPGSEILSPATKQIVSLIRQIDATRQRLLIIAKRENDAGGQSIAEQLRQLSEMRIQLMQSISREGEMTFPEIETAEGMSHNEVRGAKDRGNRKIIRTLLVRGLKIIDRQEWTQKQIAELEKALSELEGGKSVRDVLNRYPVVEKFIGSLLFSESTTEDPMEDVTLGH